MRCVECLGDPNCANVGGGGTRTCNLTTHTCVSCMTDAQCPANGGAPYCSPAGQCVPCLANGNCQTGFACDTMTYRCVRSCMNSTQCAAGGGGGGAVCNTMTNLCVQCLTNMNCAGGGFGGGTVCNTTTNRCVQCLTDANCMGGAGGGGGFCDTMTNVCVQCLTDANCTATPTRPHCSANHVCGP